MNKYENDILNITAEKLKTVTPTKIIFGGAGGISTDVYFIKEKYETKYEFTVHNYGETARGLQIYLSSKKTPDFESRNSEFVQKMFDLFNGAKKTVQKDKEDFLQKYKERMK